MGNVLTYILNLNGNAETKLGNISQKTQTLYDKLGMSKKQTQSLSSSIAGLNNAISRITTLRDLTPAKEITKIREMNSEVKRLEARVRKLKTINGSWLGGKMSAAFGTLPAFFTNPFILAGAGIGAALKEGMQQESNKTNLTTLMGGDKAGATALSDKIKNAANNSPYSQTTLLQNQQTMMGYGLDKDKSFTALGQLGDIALGDAGKLERLTLAFSQASAAGKLLGQDYRQMINAGFNPLQIISDRTGKSMKELQKDMSDGKISVDQLSQAMTWATDEQGRYHNAALNQSKTLAGRMNQLKGQFSQLAVSFTDLVGPSLTTLMGGIVSLFKGLNEGLSWFVKGLKEGAPAATAIAAAITAFSTGLIAYGASTLIAKIGTDALTWAVIKSNFAFMTNPVFLIAAGIGLLAAGVIYCWNKFEGFRKVIMGLWEAMKIFGKIVFESVIEPFKLLAAGAASIANAFKLLFAGDFKGAGAAFATGFKTLGEGILKITPFGMAGNVVANTVKGSADIATSYRWGAKKGTDSFAASQKEKKSETGVFSALAPVSDGSNLFDNSGNDSSGSGSSKGSTVRNITITIDNVVGAFTINTTNLKEDLSRVKEMVTEALLSAVNDANLAM